MGSTMDVWNFRIARRLIAEVAVRYEGRDLWNVARRGRPLTPLQQRGWVANRYYYEAVTLREHACVVASAPSAPLRQAWMSRFRARGNVTRVLAQIGVAAGMTAAELRSGRCLLQIVRDDCDAHLERIRRAPPVAAVASALVEALAIAGARRRSEALERLAARVPDAPSTAERPDCDFAIDFVLDQANTDQLREACLAVVASKTRVYQRMLAAVDQAYAIGPDHAVADTVGHVEDDGPTEPPLDDDDASLAILRALMAHHVRNAALP